MRIASATKDATGDAIPIGSANATGVDRQITFDPGTNFRFLKIGESATVTIEFDVIDDSEAPLTVSSTLTVTVQGTTEPDPPPGASPAAVPIADSTVSDNGASYHRWIPRAPLPVGPTLTMDKDPTALDVERRDQFFFDLERLERLVTVETVSDTSQQDEWDGGVADLALSEWLAEQTPNNRRVAKKLCRFVKGS